MKKKTVNYFRSISYINICISAYNWCQTGIEVPKCVYLASTAVKIEHTVDGQNYDWFRNASLMFMRAEKIVLNHSKNAKIYAFVHRNFLNDIEH